MTRLRATLSSSTSCLLYTSDNNSIVIYDGENVTELKTEIGNVLSADVGTLAGNSYIAYTVDKDGDHLLPNILRLQSRLIAFRHRKGYSEK